MVCSRCRYRVNPPKSYIRYQSLEALSGRGVGLRIVEADRSMARDVVVVGLDDRRVPEQLEPYQSHSQLP